MIYSRTTFFLNLKPITILHVVKRVVMLAGIKLKVLLEAEHGSITGELFIFCAINLSIKE